MISISFTSATDGSELALTGVKLKALTFSEAVSFYDATSIGARTMPVPFFSYIYLPSENYTKN